jgi:hypothetical protein
MYKDEPTPYIIEGLTNLAIRHSEFIPGVAMQLTALAIKESDVKAQVLALYDRADGKTATVRMNADLKLALVTELATTIDSIYTAAIEGSKVPASQSVRWSRG